MWFDEAVIYQIYPLGLCGAPAENDDVTVPRLRRLLDWVDQIGRASCRERVLSHV